MSAPLFFMLLGGIILTGFVANLLFRLTKVPSVLLLIATGVLLGPVSGLLDSSALLTIAPLFGALALLIILFEGGLELELGHVLREAPRTTLLAVLVFSLSLAAVSAFAHWVVGLSWLHALLLGAILAATSPAICMPVVSGLSVRKEVKTIVKLESALGEVLLVVVVVLLIDSQTSGATSVVAWGWSLSRSLLVALAVSSVAGVLWSRFIGWMGHEPLSYMLTLGTVCLLYVAVEELGGSPAIATLLFGLLLANMQSIAARIGPRFRELFGVDIREEQFVLSQFMRNITAEVSFLVRTFFFVYLGLLLDFRALSWTLAGFSLAIFVLLLASRRMGLAALRLGGNALSAAESATVMALLPRGLATAVVALLPMQAGIAGTEVLPLYAFTIIVLTNLYMTGGVLFAERRLRLEQATAVEGEPAVVVEGQPATEAESEAAAAFPKTPAEWDEKPAPELQARQPRPALAPRAAPLFSPAWEFAHELPPTSFTDWMARYFGLRLSDREAEYIEMIRASYLSEPLFWVQTLLGAAICALGLILDQAAIVIGGALIVPLVRPVIASGLALATGDLYLLLKLVAKLLAFAAIVVVLSAFLIDVLPFGAATSEIAARTRPTVLDFLVAFFGGMSGAALISLRRRVFHYLPGAVIGITLLPALCVMGFGIGGGLGTQLVTGGGLLFTANLFAAILGASLILWLVGIPRAADCAPVRQWKEQEMSRPIVQAILGRLKLQAVIGRTGSLRARLLVVSVFLLLLLRPLYLAFHQLTEELRTRQAVAQAQTLFDVAGRSVVLSSSSAIHDDSVAVRIQVATNEPFTAADISRFQERVHDRSGKKAWLDLVQTLGDVGQADAMRAMLAAKVAPEAPGPASIAESARSLRAAVRGALSDLPLPQNVQVIAIESDLTGAAEPRLEVAYLGHARLGEDASEMLVRLVAERSGLRRDLVALRFVPAIHHLRLSSRGRLPDSASAAIRAFAAPLAAYPAVAAELQAPPGLSQKAGADLREELRRLLEVPELRVVESADAADRRTAVLRLVAADPGS